MSNLASKKYFIPGWVLTSPEYSDGEKLIIAAISTLSTQSEAGRISTNMDSRQLAELTARHVNSVIRSISRLVSLGVLKRVKGGFLLIDQEAHGKPSDQEPAAQEPAALDHVPVDLFDGVWTWEECVRVLRSRKVCLADLRLSYERMDVCHPGRANLWALLVKSEDMLKEKGLPDTHMFGQGQE